MTSYILKIWTMTERLVETGRVFSSDVFGKANLHLQRLWDVGNRATYGKIFMLELRVKRNIRLTSDVPLSISTDDSKVTLPQASNLIKFIEGGGPPPVISLVVTTKHIFTILYIFYIYIFNYTYIYI